MARGKSTQNYLMKRQRNPQNKGANGANASNEALDVVLTEKLNSLEKVLDKVSLMIYNMFNKIVMYVTLGVFLLVFLILGHVERKITKYTYEYENIAELKYKSTYNGHYNYHGKDNYETLTAMAPEGRKIYIIYNLILIIIYSPLLFVSVSDVITDVCGYTKTNVLPLGIAVFQVIESIFLIFTILGYPNSLGLLFVSGKLAVIKYFFIFISIFVFFFGVIDRYQKKPKPTPETEAAENKEKKN